MVSVFLIYCLAGLLWELYSFIFGKRKIYVSPYQRRYLYNTPQQSFRRPPIPRHIRNEVFSRAGWKCVYCGSPYMLEVDHIYPRSKGGADHITNYQCLCKICNIKKGSKIHGQIY